MNSLHKRYKGLWPFIIFCALSVLLYIALGKNPEHIPSPLIGKSAPEFMLSDLENQFLLSKKDMQGQVWLLNVWASWCVACVEEHPLLNNLSDSSDVQIVGLNYKDEQDDAKKWLEMHGNPYSFIAVDKTGNVGIDYGVYGVPETFLIDKDGMIQYKHIGPLTQEIIFHQIIPLIDLLQKQES
ncbi:MAG: DsbE family thiol:disulfide interchange protein [Gammaproteobacteria bacterium]|nr:DsbE family thiol:disulfide interchange protein [Gammaproteobacteria bacterium]MCY4218641.1 DsbE family thiol:disulfide interchange protein [Gammaproteobacteria bacterium]MCY4274358.1 DsbE family thiol:disulfide interchange protein [Gammaproteobacteria bacterium]